MRFATYMITTTPSPLITRMLRRRWQEGAIVYQIYPRSLQDTNGDGIGDLPGITQRLPYLKGLGVNAIWLSPFYTSPMVDFGYDIADYTNVDPVFGTLDDFKEMLTEAHRLGLRVLVDLVVNHTSDEHAWFKESRTSRDSPKADWYIWKNPRIDSLTGAKLPPNNWRDALTGGPAWEWDAGRGQYYLHSWHVRQPDLSWTNKEVRNAIKDVLRFWLDMGVDGFRADAVDWMAKDPLFRDDPPDPAYVEGEDSPYDALLHANSRGWPTEYAYLAEMTGVFEEEKYAGRQCFMVAETYQERHNPAEAYVAFYGGIDPEYAAPFNFEGLYLGWEAGKWRRFLRQFHQGLKGLSTYCVPSYAFGNHDNPRLASRLGDAAARSAALMQLSLPGMVVVYYGEEIGMHNAPLPLSAQKDVYFRSRDPSRTPMQWNGEKNAGFSTADTTWLPVHPEYSVCNVAAEAQDPHSFLSLYRALMKLRNASPALQFGSVQVVEAGHPDILGFIRSEKDEHYVVLINFSGKAVSCVPGVKLTKLVISTEPQTKLVHGADGEVELLPHEGALFLQ